jgi:S1-C subfamily serine protease
VTRPSTVVAALGAALLAAGCSASTRNAPRTLLSTKEIVQRNKPAIVRIESRVTTQGGPDRRQYGTGFVVRADGRIATNLHVIIGSGDVKVRLADGAEFKALRVVAIDPQRDLAIIGIDAVDLPTVHLGNSDEVSAGDRVVAIGNPLGVLDYTVSDGLISSVRQPEGLKVLQISAPISQGSSGGPLFNAYGEVIGVATLISAEGQNLNFGMPSNYLIPLLSSKQQGESMAAFAARFRPALDSGAGEGGRERLPRAPERRVPAHPISVLDGCSADQLAAVFRAISEAISIGAPVYNRNEYEACFVIYRKVAEKFESDRAVCKGVRDAFGQGLLRAETMESFSDKAWAMRDTFDGLLGVIERKVSAGRP